MRHIDSENKKNSTADTSKGLTVVTNLDSYEKKGPVIVAISQPLKYHLNEKQNPSLEICPPVSFEKLALLYDSLGIETKIHVVFGANLNFHRYQAIEGIQHNKAFKETEAKILANEASIKAAKDETRWIKDHTNYFEQKGNKRNNIITHSFSKMKIECNQLIDSVRAGYQSNDSKKLTYQISSYAKGAIRILYPDLLRSAKGTQFFSTTDSKAITLEEVTERLRQASIEYGLEEFALLSHLSHKVGATCVLYNEETKKSHSPKPKSKSFMTSYAPILINLIMKEFILKTQKAQRVVSCKTYTFSEVQKPLISGVDFFILFHVIAALPGNLYAAEYPKTATAFFSLVSQFLTKDLSTAMLKAVAYSHKKPSQSKDDKSSIQSIIPIYTPENSTILLNWLSGFIAALLCQTHSEESAALAIVNSLIFTNLNLKLAQQINNEAAQLSEPIRGRKITNSQDCLKSLFKAPTAKHVKKPELPETICRM